MAAAGIREASDIDMLVAEEVFAQLKDAGWQVLDKGDEDKPLTYDVFEAHHKWNLSSYKPTLKHLLSTAEMIDGIPFAALEEVRKWKVSSGRSKDLIDIKLIEDYLAKKK